MSGRHPNAFHNKSSARSCPGARLADNPRSKAIKSDLAHTTSLSVPFVTLVQLCVLLNSQCVTLSSILVCLLFTPTYALTRRLTNHAMPPVTFLELEIILEQEWQKIPQERVDNLIALFTSTVHWEDV
ncbi:hypothetical protein AVEN_78675-1 [Araneus ventricosus]|uniref:Uncharacterized protein n=1 Tax=Araneus ventricosus TaxID=182803 RepID=A0A4Y2W362_ARAVE|nr:hypothetical protein AVEN_78675-1 [Araneus ventricosus]